MRKYLDAKTDQPRKMDLFDFVEFCRQQGISGVELTSYYFPETVTNDYLLKLKRHCHLLGMTISGGAIRNDFCSQNESQIEKDLSHTRKWIDHYALIGAPAIRIFAGNQPKDEERATTLARCARHTEAACAYAAEKGVLLALENHGGVTAKAEGLLEIVKQVNSPAFGVNFDSGNFHSTSDPYAELEMIAPYAVNAQIKVEMQVDGKKVEADLQRIIKILRAANYSGWVALEYEAAEEPFEAIPRWLKQLKPLMDG
jgi:sugar phosphate isomerase/epimerase